MAGPSSKGSFFLNLKQITILSPLIPFGNSWQLAGVEKNKLKPWQKKQWCIGRVTADFVWRMEDILEL